MCAGDEMPGTAYQQLKEGVVNTKPSKWTLDIPPKFFEPMNVRKGHKLNFHSNLKKKHWEINPGQNPLP